jgi:P22 coat protein - gene protein 5
LSNQLLTISMITREALRVLVNNLVFTNHVERQYDDYYGKVGAKIGNVLNIRKPPRFVRTDGQGLQLQDVTETSVPLVLTTQGQRAFVFSSQDLELSIDDFSKRFVKPAVASLANQVDYDGLQQVINVYQAVGTPGTTPNALLTYLQAQQKLNEAAAADDDERYIVIGPPAQASIVDALKGLFHASSEISEQYKRGKMGTTIGAEWYMDQNVATQTAGTLGGTPTTLTTGSPQTGSSLSIVALGSTNTVLQGDRFTIAGVHSVNPQNFTSTGSLQVFVATASATASGGAITNLQISPAITTSGPFQTVDAAPATSAAITFLSAPSVASPQNVLFHKEAFAMACADLPLPGGVDMAKRISDKELGLSIRLVRAYDINQDRFPLRLDFLYGWTTLYPQLACVVNG